MNYPYRSHFQYERTPGRRRVVVTGIGAVSAAGTGAQALWETLMAGRTCIDVFSNASEASSSLSVAAEVKDWDPTRWIEPRMRPRRMVRQTQFAVVAAQEALRDAGFTADDLKHRRVAVIVGSAAGPLGGWEGFEREINSAGPRGVAPGTISGKNMQAAPVAVAELLNLPAANVFGLMNNCTSGVDAIGTAADLIRFGRYDLVVAGGAEAPLSSIVTSLITASGICSKRELPGDASRPFDRERDGGVLGEGAGMVIMEADSVAEERGVRPYVEIIGTHSCPDEQRDRPSSGLEMTMRGALDNAGVSVREIDFISAWGCGHPLFDRCETDAIKNVFGEEAYRVAVGSIKGAVGIPLAASGVLQLIALALSYRHGVLPPTVNWRHGDLDCDLDFVGGEPRRVRLRKTLLNAHGLSGGNISLVINNAS